MLEVIMPKSIYPAALSLLYAPAPGLSLANTGESPYFSPDGKYFAANFHGNINLGAIKGSERKFVKAFNAQGDSEGKIYSFFGFTPDSRRLAVSYDSKSELRFLSLNGELHSALPAHPLMKISPGFKWAIESPVSGSAARHNLSRITGEGVISKYSLPEDYLWSAFSHDDKLLAFVYRQEDVKSGVTSHILKVMDTKTGKYLRQYVVKDKRASAINAVAFSPNGKMLAYAVDDKVTVVNTATWGTSSFVSSDGADSGLLAFSRNGAYLAVNYAGASVKVYSLPDYRVVVNRNMEGKNAWYVVDLAFSRDSSFLGLLGSRTAMDESGYSARFIDLPPKIK